MADSEVVATISAIMARLGLTMSEASAFANTSSATLRYSIATGTLPGREAPRRAIRDFAMRNANARSRAEIKLA